MTPFAPPESPAGTAPSASQYDDVPIRRPSAPVAEPQPETAPLQQQPSTTDTPVSHPLPELPADYARVWADHWVAEGGDVSEEARNLQFYRQAIAQVDSGQLKLPGIDGRQLVRSVRTFVARDFRAHVRQRRADNIYHQALYGFLHRVAVERLRTGDLPGLPASPEAADAIEQYIDEQFTQTHIGE